MTPVVRFVTTIVAKHLKYFSHTVTVDEEDR